MSVPRSSPDDWLRAGLELLRAEGQEALTIERLCRALRRTKGSFYHHFGDIDAYCERLFAFWEAYSTFAPMHAADASDCDGAARRRRLHHAVSRLDLRVERAMQAWSLRDPRARPARTRVDALRLEYLGRLWREEGAGEADARAFARQEYASFLGAMQLFDLETASGSIEARACRGSSSSGCAPVCRARAEPPRLTGLTEGGSSPLHSSFSDGRRLRAGLRR